MAFSKKIFNKSKSIPFGKSIYKSKDNGIYRFGGVRDKRLGKECVFYLIPNLKNKKQPYIKAFEKKEVEELWTLLITNQELKTKDFKKNYKDLYKEGACCVSAFFGIINTLFPKKFRRERGKISIR
ncbi:MAG: hypothetical protein HY252_14145 [Sphingobacteriales bacterium]|nr:hypothetical protein [Sphingobacteriales bacterium]